MLFENTGACVWANDPEDTFFSDISVDGFNFT